MNGTTKENLSQKILLYTWYPLILFVTISLAIFMIHQEINHAVVIASISIGTAVLIWVMEYIIPEHKAWQPNWKVIKNDLIHMITTSVIPTQLFEKLLGFIILASAVWGAGYVQGFQIWPNDWPLVFQMLLAIHLGDLGYYILHRSLHEIPEIWPFHAVHHSPEQLYVIASNRAHPIQIFFTFGTQIVILYAMGINSEALLMFSIFVSVNGQLQHCNIKMRCGIFNWIFATSDLHRWHHSIEIVESNSNYGNNVVLWDILFGTRFLPKQVSIPANHIGLPPGTDFPDNYWGHLKAPFNWENIRYDREKDAN